VLVTQKAAASLIPVNFAVEIQGHGEAVFFGSTYDYNKSFSFLAREKSHRNFTSPFTSACTREAFNLGAGVS
jgi:hypothetical protein